MSQEQDSEQTANLRVYLALLTGTSYYSTQGDDADYCLNILFSDAESLKKAEDIIAHLLLLGVQLDKKSNKYIYSTDECPRDYVGCVFSEDGQAVPLNSPDAVGFVVYQLYGDGSYE